MESVDDLHRDDPITQREHFDKAMNINTTEDSQGKMNHSTSDPIRELASLTAFIRGAFHNIGNIVNTLCISAETALEVVERLDIRGVGEAGKLLGSFDEELSGQYDEKHPLRLLPTYLSELSSRIEEQRSKGIAELQVLVESAENIRENLRFQQDLVDDDEDSAFLDIRRVVERVVSLHQNVLRREHISVDIQSEDVPLTRLKQRPLIQVLTNLIVNSKHAMQEYNGERRLELSVKSDTRQISVTVTDSGIGINPEDIEHLFERGFTTKSHGSGIGLFVSRQLVEDMGGCLNAKSEGPNKGATFVLTLPVVA